MGGRLEGEACCVVVGGRDEGEYGKEGVGDGVS